MIQNVSKGPRNSPTLDELVSVLSNMPLPYAAIDPPARPRKLVPMDLPDSIACRARYRRMDSGMSLQSPPSSMLFFAMFFILARLGPVSVLSKKSVLDPFASYLF